MGSGAGNTSSTTTPQSVAPTQTQGMYTPGTFTGPQSPGAYTAGSPEAALTAYRAQVLQNAPPMGATMPADPRALGAMLNQQVRPDYQFAQQLGALRALPYNERMATGQAMQDMVRTQNLGGNQARGIKGGGKGGLGGSTPQTTSSLANNPLMALLAARNNMTGGQ
jgi:hypothetical protein